MALLEATASPDARSRGSQALVPGRHALLATGAHHDDTATAPLQRRSAPRSPIERRRERHPRACQVLVVLGIVRSPPLSDSSVNGSTSAVALRWFCMGRGRQEVAHSSGSGDGSPRYAAHDDITCRLERQMAVGFSLSCRSAAVDGLQDQRCPGMNGVARDEPLARKERHAVGWRSSALVELDSEARAEGV
jgi:hypothetical protein